MQEELVDRFGRPPEPAQALLACHRLRARREAAGRGQDRRRARSAATIQFVKEPPFDAGKLILLVQRDGRIRFAGPDRVRIERAAPTLAERVALVREFLGQLRCGIGVPGGTHCRPALRPSTSQHRARGRDPNAFAGSSSHPRALRIVAPRCVGPAAIGTRPMLTPSVKRPSLPCEVRSSATASRSASAMRTA